VDSPRKHSQPSEQAAALIIVLAMVVLATALAVAYFSRATSDRPVAHGSFNQAKVDQFAQSAMDNIIGDLCQEITNGSASPAPTFGPSASPGPFTLYVPTATPNIVPVRSPAATPGTTPAIPNLIRRSVRSDGIPFPARASRASAVNSYSDVSANGRSITLARWNSHYLIPKADPTTSGSDPITTGFSLPNFWAPDWVFVKAYDPATQQGGVTVITSPDPLVIGRYAYMIYDEGGLIDMNAAGYPSPTAILQYGRKGSLAFADLTGLGSYGLTAPQIDNVVGWRNYASAQPSGSFSPTPNFTFSTDSTNTYYNFVLSDPNYIKLTNFLLNQPGPLTYSSIFFLTTAWQAPQNNNQTDQGFNSRQSLLQLRSALSSGGTGFVNALQYLGTFSREALASVPQWSPTSPDSINPNFQTLLVTAPFTRNNGTTAYVGDYLINQRFLLQRLSWLTYKGPSGPSVANPTGRNIPNNAPNLGGCIPVSTTCAPDYDMWLLTRSNGITFGLTSVFLKQGTDANILNYFGLAWDTTNERWNYVGHGGSTTPINSIATFGVGGTQAATREPDFFELLQAGILNSSLGDSFSSDPALPSVHQQSKMLHILTIGANLIAQSRADSYPVRIACTVNVGGTPTIMEAVGMPRLPCLSSLAACPVGGTGLTGGVNWLLVPNLWDPFRDSWDLTEFNTGNTGNKPLLTPGYLRPPVQITVRGIVTFAAANVSQSGSIDPTSIFPFQPPVSTGNINVSLPLNTGPTTNNAFGRDGLLNAMRLGANDIGGTAPSLFDPTQSPTGLTSTFQWNRVHPPTNDNSTYRTDDYVIFRLSLPGILILPLDIILGRNPVLILQPGFQVSLDYQSPNGQWYSYSFLQGNNATSTWISPDSSRPLTIGTSFSQYFLNIPPPPGAFPTIVNSGTLTPPTPWNDVTGALAHAPMFAKADPRSIRYDSQIGVVSLANPPMPFNSAGVIGSIWPGSYATPPPMTPSAFPVPTPTPNPNPALYSQLADNSGDHGNPYSEAFGIAELSNPYRPVMMNRPFRSVGEMGYAFRDQPFKTLSFSSTNSPDAGLLDLFTTIAYGATPTPSPSPSITPTYPTPTATPRGGVINLNSMEAPALAAVLTSTITSEDIPRQFTGGVPSPMPTTLTTTQANNVATSLVSSTSSAPVVNRARLADLIAETGLGATMPKTQRESIARALGEVDQTRTWNLMLDVIAQSGRYAPGEADLKKFVVEGEQRYWIHVAIDRFTGQVLDKQIEVVTE
jgi:hypothetical protein